jgi:hypothetical protein
MTTLAGYCKSYSTQVTPTDRQHGIAGYTVSIEQCPVTRKPTNLLFKVPDGRLVVAYDQAAANILYERQFENLANQKGRHEP